MSDIFSDASMGNIPTPSRFIFAPINSGFATLCTPRKKMINFHSSRSGPETGIIFIGNIAVNENGRTNQNTPVLTKESHIPRLAVISRSIQNLGSIPGIQLAYMPSQLAPKPQWKTDKEKEHARLINIVHALSPAEIDEILQYFINAISLAASRHFKVMQIHAAHGYFLSLLLSKETNKRNDRYSLYSDWLESFISRVKANANGSAISFRISINSGLGDEEAEQEESLNLAQRLANAGVCNIDLSSGFYTISRSRIYPHSSGFNSSNYKFAERLAKQLNTTVTYNGDIRTLDNLPQEVPQNLFLGVGRALLADPLFLKKLKAQQTEQVVPCKRCMDCHYFSRGKTHIECGMNPNLAQKGT